MRLYKVTFDNQPEFVEAPDFGSAVLIWREHLMATNPGDFDGTENPESLELISESPVIRGG